MQLVKNVNITHLTADGTNYLLAAGTTDVESGYVDMADYEGCLFIVVLGDNADTATLTAKVEGCDTSGGTYTALTGASYAGTMNATDHDHKLVIFDVYQPSYRYLHLDFDRGTANSAISAVLAIQYKGKCAPITQAVTAGQAAVAGAVVAVSIV